MNFWASVRAKAIIGVGTACGWCGRHLQVTVAGGVAFLLCTEAAALMVPLATTTIVDRADCIVEGCVTSSTSRWTDDHSAIVTEVEIDATDVFLGGTNRVTFLYEGGRVGDLEQRVSDMPTLNRGQRILVFLREKTPHESKRDLSGGQRGRGYALLGAAQGLYRIEAGRAIKDGFEVVGDASAIERNVDAAVLKERVRQRLRTSRHGGPRL